MSNARATFDNPFDGFLAAVNRPTAPSSSLGVAEPAAEASSPRASAAFFSDMTESADGGAGPSPSAANGAVRRALLSSPARGEEDVALSVTLSPAVALILSLVTNAKGISADEAVSRGICVFAQTIGLPSLARQDGEDDALRHANSESGDLHAVPPRFQRAAPSRFKRFKRGA